MVQWNLKNRDLWVSATWKEPKRKCNRLIERYSSIFIVAFDTCSKGLN